MDYDLVILGRVWQEGGEEMPEAQNRPMTCGWEKVQVACYQRLSDIERNYLL